MKNNYPLDATVISILFDIRSAEEAEKVYTKFEELLGDVFDKAWVDFLLQKGFTEEQLKEFFLADNPEDFPEIIKHYGQQEFLRYALQKTEEFSKKIYDDRLPLLKEENKKALDQHLADLQVEMSKQTDTILNTIQKSVQLPAQGSVQPAVPDLSNDQTQAFTSISQPSTSTNAQTPAPEPMQSLTPTLPADQSLDNPPPPPSA